MLVLFLTAHSDIDSSFKDHLKQLAPFLLSRDQLVVKTINGAPLTGQSLYDIFGVSVM